MKVGFMSKILFVHCGLLVISQSIVIQLNKQVVSTRFFFYTLTTTKITIK